MSKVLAYTSPARGHLYPLVPILEELRGRGHEISVLTLASQVEQMRSLGFDAAPIDPAIEAIEHDDYLARSPIGALKRAMRTFAARGHHETADLGRAIERTDPDALLVDFNSWGATASADLWGGPWATWCPFPLPLPSRDAPPFGPGFPPAAGPVGRLRDQIARPIMMRLPERTIVPAVNEIRSTLGLPPLSGAVEAFTKAPLLLYLTSEPFEYPRSDWPSNVRLVGPCDWDPPASTPEWLTKIEAPIVLVTTSSEYQDDGRLVRCALEALATEDVHVVATVPSIDPAGFDVPPNARMMSFIPHGLVLDRAACAVTHGGMGATQKALARGVPVCAVPFGRDQLEVARRVEHSGAGTRLPAPKLRPDRLRTAVRDAINRREGAALIAAGYRAAGGPGAAAGAFEELIGASETGTRRQTAPPRDGRAAR